MSHARLFLAIALIATASPAAAQLDVTYGSPSPHAGQSRGPIDRPPGFYDTQGDIREQVIQDRFRWGTAYPGTFWGGPAVPHSPVWPPPGQYPTSPRRPMTGPWFSPRPYTDAPPPASLPGAWSTPYGR